MEVKYTLNDAALARILFSRLQDLDMNTLRVLVCVCKAWQEVLDVRRGFLLFRRCCTYRANVVKACNRIVAPISSDIIRRLDNSRNAFERTQVARRIMRRGVRDENDLLRTMGLM